jgi:hypothetical protein
MSFGFIIIAIADAQNYTIPANNRKKIYDGRTSCQKFFVGLQMLTKKNIEMEQKENREINSIIKKLEKAEIKGDALQIYLCCDALLEIYASNYGAEMAVALCQKAIDALQEAGAARRAELASAYYKQGLFLQDKYYVLQGNKLLA